MNQITAFITKYWKHPIALIIYAIIIIYIIYKWGKSEGDVKPSELPNETDWGKDLTTSQSDEIRRIADRLYRDMDSYLVSVSMQKRDIQAYKDFLTLPEREFVGVSNDFNDRYYTEDDGKLYQWIMDESFTYTFGASGDIREAILEKMEKYNLK